jgi:hypothetical protein
MPSPSSGGARRVAFALALSAPVGRRDGMTAQAGADALSRVQEAHAAERTADDLRDTAVGILSRGKLQHLESAGLVVVDAADYERVRLDARRWREHVAACQADDEHRAPAARGSVAP